MYNIKLNHFFHNLYISKIYILHEHIQIFFVNMTLCLYKMICAFTNI